MSKRIISWNVNGIRASVKKGFFDRLEEMNPDILCLQETKAQDDQVREALFGISDYQVYSNSATKKGYSGTAILSKIAPLSVVPDMGIEEHDDEGRVLCAEFDDFYVVNVYVPNSGDGLKRLEYRKKWDSDFLNYLKELNSIKPVILCGDLNVAHTEMDIARAKSNYNKSAGYTQTEIDGLSNFINSGLVDSFREKHPDKIKYSWWSYRANARTNNIGWRIDYFLVNKNLLTKISAAFILNEIEGSDHCPVGIEIE
ncbi:MAG: exodeoxyribonuclease-3 [Sphingobacteriales bacterium]|jgi:exodeoxyribonuclease-3